MLRGRVVFLKTNNFRMNRLDARWGLGEKSPVRRVVACARSEFVGARSLTRSTLQPWSGFLVIQSQTLSVIPAELWSNYDIGSRLLVPRPDSLGRSVVKETNRWVAQTGDSKPSSQRGAACLSYDRWFSSASSERGRELLDSLLVYRPTDTKSHCRGNGSRLRPYEYLNWNEFVVAAEAPYFRGSFRRLPAAVLSRMSRCGTGKKARALKHQDESKTP